AAVDGVEAPAGPRVHRRHPAGGLPPSVFAAHHRRHRRPGGLGRGVRRGPARSVGRPVPRGRRSTVRPVATSPALAEAVAEREAARPLACAGQLRGRGPLVTRLFGAGAGRAVGRREGWTPLMLAASDGREALVRQLLDAGADVNASAYAGELNALGAARYHA